MPLTTFTVSELLYHYLKLTCEMPVKEKDDGNDDDDDDDDASSVSSVASGMASHEEMVSIAAKPIPSVVSMYTVIYLIPYLPYRSDGRVVITSTSCIL